jgi:hypothetical protein
MKRRGWQLSTGTDMDQRDIDIRNRTYRLFIQLGRAPEPEDVASASGLTAGEIAKSWRRLHDAHALVLHPDGTEILMANPFSAVPTRHRVHAAWRWWYAPCAWDAFAICAALHTDGEIESSCADCGDAISINVRDQRPDDASLLFHCLVPAAHWWDDIGFA